MLSDVFLYILNFQKHLEALLQQHPPPPKKKKTHTVSFFFKSSHIVCTQLLPAGLHVQLKAGYWKKKKKKKKNKLDHGLIYCNQLVWKINHRQP